MTYQPIPMPTSLVRPLRILREQRLMRQTDLSKSSGVSLRTLVAIERSHCPPRMDTRRKILLALDIPLEQHTELFGPLPDCRVKR
jgi:transcriptional regulator with XRE-family HTH domain